MMRGMKALLGACMFVIAGLVALSTFSYTPSTSSKALHSIVSHTHQQLNQLHKLKEELGGDQPLDSTILTELGFSENPILFPAHSWANVSMPVIVSAISSLEFSLLGNLLKTCQILSSSNSSIIIYALDLSNEEMKQLESECNDTCEIINFDFSRYPPHVRYFKLGAFRPIIIQEMLQHSSELIWVDPCIQLLELSPVSSLPISNSLSKQWGKKALKNAGILTWPLLHPTSHLPTAALTHPDMFRPMGTFKKEYDFQKMSDQKLIYIINLPTVHQYLMKSWVRCALTAGCISPIGAQATGCKYDKKPRFRYSGCHLYDTSAFNIALGLAFGMDKDTYIESTQIYECVSSLEFEKNPSTSIQEEESLMTPSFVRSASAVDQESSSDKSLSQSYSQNSTRSVLPQSNTRSSIAPFKTHTLNSSDPLAVNSSKVIKELPFNNKKVSPALINTFKTYNKTAQPINKVTDELSRYQLDKVQKS